MITLALTWAALIVGFVARCWWASEHRVAAADYFAIFAANQKLKRQRDHARRVRDFWCEMAQQSATQCPHWEGDVIRAEDLPALPDPNAILRDYARNLCDQKAIERLIDETRLDHGTL